MKMSMEHLWNDADRLKHKYSEKNYPSAILSTKKPVGTNLGSNLPLYGKKPANNRLCNVKSWCAFSDFT
jgi:hypothetical protein